METYKHSVIQNGITEQPDFIWRSAMCMLCVTNRIFLRSRMQFNCVCAGSKCFCFLLGAEVPEVMGATLSKDK